MTASFESATRTPVCVCPFLAVPFHSNVGMTSSISRGAVGSQPTVTPGGPRARRSTYAGRDGRLALIGAVGPPWNNEPAPREIISCSSSGFDERDSAVCSVISFLKYRVANDWLNVCIPYLACPVCIIE